MTVKKNLRSDASQDAATTVDPSDLLSTETSQLLAPGVDVTSMFPAVDLTTTYAFNPSSFVPVASNAAVLAPAAPATQTLAAVDPVSTNVDLAVKGNVAFTNFGVTGAGIKIGILSDSFQVVGGASAVAADIADGALPASGVTVITGQDGKNGTSGASADTDEGRAIAQTIHSIAPNAQLFFATTDGGDASFASNITALVSAGVNIIIDDTTYFDEPFFQTGSAIDNAITAGAAAGVTFFTAAGNEASNFYQNTFAPISVTLPGLGTKTVESFGGTTGLQNITIGPNSTVTIDLQWAQPFASIGGSAGSQNSLTMEAFFAGQPAVASTPAPNGDPFQQLVLSNPFSNSRLFQLAIIDNPGNGFTATPTGQLFKYIALTNGVVPVTIANPSGGVGSGTVFGHREIPQEAAVGAVPVTNPTAIENFSSVGPGALLFASNGNPLSPAVNPGQVAFVAPDGITTSVPLFSNFTGTSESAGVTAAVASLALQANPLLTSQDIDNLLRDSSVKISGASTAAAGAGLIQADKAVQFAKTGTITEFAGGNSVLTGTHLGDTFAVIGSGNTLIGTGGVNTASYASAGAGLVANAGDGVAFTLNNNLLTSSNNFASGWTLANSALGAPSAGPDGQQSLFNVAPNSASAEAIFQGVTVATAGSYTISIFAKANGFNWLGLGFGNGATSDGVFFNLATGAVGHVASGDTDTIQSLGNGLYRVTVTRTLSAGTNYLMAEVHSADNQALGAVPGENGTSGILMSDAGLQTAAQFQAADTLQNIQNVTGSSGGSSVLVGGAGGSTLGASGGNNTLIGTGGANTASYATAAAGMVVSTTDAYSVAGDLLTSANNFASGWTLIRTTLGAPATGPDGEQSLFNVAPNIGGAEGIFQAVTVASAGSYTISMFAKANGFNWLGLGFGNGATSDGVFFNLATGTVGHAATGDTDTIQSLGNGLYRVSVTRTLSAGTNYLMAEVHSADNQALGAVPGANGTLGLLLSDTDFQTAAQFQKADTLQNIQNLTGSSSGGSVLVGGAGGSTLGASGGNNTLIGTGGANTASYANAAAGMVVSTSDAYSVAGNLLTSANNFASGWTLIRTTLGAPATGPDGEQSLFNVAPNIGGAEGIFQAVTVASAGSYTISMFAKANGFNWLGLGFGNGATSDGAFFNLATGAVGTIAAGDTAAIQSLGNGLYRVSVTRTLSAGTNYLMAEVHSANGEGLISVPGANGTNGLLLSDADFQTAAQFQQADTLQNIQNLVGSSSGGSVLVGGAGGSILSASGGNNTLIGTGGVNTASYANSTVGVVASVTGGIAYNTNGDLLTSANNFASGWTLVHTALVGAPATGPDGQLSLFSVAPNSAGAEGIFQTVNVAAAGSYTISMFAKANGFNFLGLGFGNGATSDGAFFNLATGAVGHVAAGDTAAIQSLGNGLYRVSVTRTLSAGTNYLMAEVHSADNQALGAVPGENGTLGLLLSDADFQTAAQFQQADTLQNIQNLVGSSFNDVLVGSASGGSVLTAGAGNDTLLGTGSSNTLIAGGGSDTLINGAGAASSFYQYQAGDGAATIANGTSGHGSASNELDFGGSLTDQNLWFLQNGNNLQIDVMGTQNHVTVANWFTSADNTLSEITAGGLKIDAQVSALVTAMATFQTGNPSFDPTAAANTTAPADATLQSAISAAWHA